MKITVEISDSELKETRKATGEKKKGPAIRKLVADSLKLRRRREMAEKFVSGAWSVEFAGFEERRASERARARVMAQKWKQ